VQVCIDRDIEAATASLVESRAIGARLADGNAALLT
jgi:hypothetical protein